jgi:hypothetical protein
LDRAGRPFFANYQDYSVAGAPGGSAELAEDRAPGEPASFCGNPTRFPAAFLFPPILFPRNVLPSGPQVRFFAEKGTPKVRQAVGEIEVDKEPTKL